MDDSRYGFSSDMDEISGFGGTYEAGCRVMVQAGMEWFDQHPDAQPKYRGFKGIYGVLGEDNADAKALSAAMVAAADAAYPEGGVTGAMHQATVSHVLWAHRYGWPAYCESMRKRRTEAAR